MAIDAVVKTCTVVLHDDATSSEDVICCEDVLPLGGIGLLTAPGAKPLCVQSRKLAPTKNEISLHVSIARLFSFENRMRANIEVLENVEDATATHVELLFRDQQLSRADMWRIRAQIDSSILYQTQKVQYLGSLTATVAAIYKSGVEVQSALVTHPRTRLIFRSASAHFTILIQVSKEMLEDWIGTDLMYERVLNGFLADLFGRWDQTQVRHQISVVLFGRIPRDPGEHQAGQDTKVPEYDDFFQVVVLDAPTNSWRGLLRKLKAEFNKMQLPQQVSLAANGNMLEAIHIATLDFAERNPDQHLSSTGTSIIAITAGIGLFETDYEKLKRTTELLMGSNISVDIVSVSRQPLHAAPLFQYERNHVTEYALPHWADISFWAPPNDAGDSRWIMPEVKSSFNKIKIERLSIFGGKNSSRALGELMDEFDRSTFEFPSSAAKTSPTTDKAVEELSITASGETTPSGADTPTTIVGSPKTAPSILSKKSQKAEPLLQTNIGHSQPVQKAASIRHPLMQTGRNISLGPRGLAPSLATVSTGVTTQHAQQDRDDIMTTPFVANSLTSGLAKQIKESLRKKPSHQSLNSQRTLETSQPILSVDIPMADPAPVEGRDPASVVEEAVLENAGPVTGESVDSTSTIPNVQPKPALNGGEKCPAALPWLTLLNPCYPRRDNMRIASEYRQWQNVFPRPVSSAVFKWESMCSPAALPLMTENRPSLSELESRFSKKVRRLLATSITETSTIQRAMAQMIYLRLNAGFQVVSSHKRAKQQIGLEHIDRILLSIGEKYHEVCKLSDSEIQVTEYEPDPDLKQMSANVDDEDNLLHCSAEMKSTISRKARSIKVDWLLTPHFLDWSLRDDRCMNLSLSAYDGDCRMRFVLIPAEPLRSEIKTLSRPRELSDEEHRLEGIQKLTQMWQRHRFFTDEDQSHQASMIKPKTSGSVERDPNPLAIEYQTRDTSVVVGAYGLNLTKSGDNDPTTKLFSESEQFHTSNFDTTKLTRQMQEPPPHGVEFRDRRWFTSLHLKCFRGDEMTNWLLRVFKDLQTREDAVALGNQLMDREIFSHVRGSHEFRDGNYFYQIKAAYRTTDYPDTASFFSRPVGRSVPSTPMSEPKQSPAVRPVQADADHSGRNTPTPTLAPVGKKEKREVMLSQKLQYNVDSGRKSSQVEIINVHYDRIHNPENCYHVQIDWSDTTAKLIRDSIARWATLVESHGLRLVQLPLKEACKVSELHLFEQPLPVKLAVHLSVPNPITPRLDGHALSHPNTEDTDAFHKAVLRKMGFVLDLESAASFPSNVEVSYSWGRPDYEYTQFIHKSGLLLAQITNDGERDFLLLPNRLAAYLTTSSARKAETASVETIVRQFVTFCRDEKALRALLDELNKPKVFTPSPFANPLSPAKADHDVPPMELTPQLGHRALLRNAG